MVGTCEIKRRFRACGRPGVAVCQYCGRSFCDQHGARQEDGQEICTRSICERKKANLDQHVIYQEAVARRNGEQLCGDETCERRMSGRCSKCGGFFCLSHLEERVVEVRRGSTAAEQRASLCRHCVKRRDLWSKM